MARGLHWFRNDLRLADNTALAELASRVDCWLPVFILDDRIMGPRSRPLSRSRFLLDCLERLSIDLGAKGIPLLVRSGDPAKILPRLLEETGAEWLSFNQSASPYGGPRDLAVRRRAEKLGVRLITPRDDVVFGADEVRKADRDPYVVYTPYRRAWWLRWRDRARLPRRAPRLPPAIPGFAASDPALPVLDPASGESSVKLPTGGEAAARRRLASFLSSSVARYQTERDRPDLDGTSRLSPYLRFGAISPRQCFAQGEAAAQDDPRKAGGVEKWLDELVWREFYAALLEESPRVRRQNQRREYDAMVWNDDARGFDAWCQGRTGYPIVDAAMRQLVATGWMHNRARMIVASFLTKDLLIDWREGERFFFQHLVDGDPASNSGGWQWAASTGTDAQPYFRIFNPTLQGKKFDPEGAYVRQWIPELRELPASIIHEPWKAGSLFLDYAAPIVDHATRRQLALDRYSAARSAPQPS